MIDRSLHKNYDCNDNFTIFSLLLFASSSFRSGMWENARGFIEITKQVNSFLLHRSRLSPSDIHFINKLFSLFLPGKTTILSKSVGKYLLMINPIDFRHLHPPQQTFMMRKLSYWERGSFHGCYWLNFALKREERGRQSSKSPQLSNTKITLVRFLIINICPKGHILTEFITNFDDYFFRFPNFFEWRFDALRWGREWLIFKLVICVWFLILSWNENKQSRIAVIFDSYFHHVD